MPQAKITYSWVGGTAKTDCPNIEGSAISRNMFTERNVDGPENKDLRTFMQSCPGIKYIMNLGQGKQCDGIYVPTTGLKTMNYSPCMFVAFNGQIIKIDKANNTEVIGEYALGNTVEFAESGGERAILLWVDGQSIYGYDLKVGETVEITLPKRIDEDSSYIKPSHIAVVSGSIVLNDLGSGYVYYSVPYPLSKKVRKVFDIVNGTVQYEADGITVQMKEVDSGVYCFLDDYGVQQYFNGESSSDKTIAVTSVGALLTLFGPSSIEFWQRGDAESYQTWQRTSYTINKEQGLEAPYSIASINHTQLCIGTGKSNAKCILRIDDTNVQKISPLWLDRILNENDVTGVRAWTYSKNNHSFYIFSIKNETYCFDISTGEWHVRSSRNFYTGKNKPYMPQFAVWFNNKIITGSCENGNLYELADDYFYEDFDAVHKLPLLRVRQTPVVTSNYKPFVIYELSLECNTGAINEYGKKGVALLEMSNDGGYTYGNVRSASVGERGQYSVRLRWLNLGMTRQCVLRVSFSEPCNWVISDSSIRFQELATPV